MSGKILVVVAAAGAALLMLKGDAFGASGGVGPGDTKKATVMSGITAPEQGPAPSYENQPAPYSPPAQNFIPNPFTNPNPDALPFIPSPYILQQMEKMYYPQAETTTAYDFTSSGKYGTGTLAEGIASVDPKYMQRATPEQLKWLLTTPVASKKGTIYPTMEGVPSFSLKEDIAKYNASNPSKKLASTSPSTVSRGGYTYSDKPTGGTGMAPGSVSRVIDGKKYYR